MPGLSLFKRASRFCEHPSTKYSFLLTGTEVEIPFNSGSASGSTEFDILPQTPLPPGGISPPSGSLPPSGPPSSSGTPAEVLPSRLLTQMAKMTSGATPIATCAHYCRVTVSENIMVHTWYPYKFDTTITAATLVKIVNTIDNSTRTSWRMNDLPSGYTLPPRNAAGTQVQTVNYTRFGTKMTTVMYVNFIIRR